MLCSGTGDQRGSLHRVVYLNWVLKYRKEETSLGVQWLSLWVPNAGGTGSIPSQGTKIPHATWCGRIIIIIIWIGRGEGNREGHFGWETQHGQRHGEGGGCMIWYVVQTSPLEGKNVTEQDPVEPSQDRSPRVLCLLLSYSLTQLHLPGYSVRSQWLRAQSHNGSHTTSDANCRYRSQITHNFCPAWGQIGGSHDLCLTVN